MLTTNCVKVCKKNVCIYLAFTTLHISVLFKVHRALIQISAANELTRSTGHASRYRDLLVANVRLFDCGEPPFTQLILTYALPPFTLEWLRVSAWIYIWSTVQNMRFGTFKSNKENTAENYCLHCSTQYSRCAGGRTEVILKTLHFFQ